MSDHLLRAISALMENPDIDLVSERPWHSLNFAGMQVSLQTSFSGEYHAVTAAKLERQLKEQEFDVPNYLVADIAVTELIVDQAQTRLTIDALLIED